MAIKSKGTSGTTYHDQDVIALIDSGHGSNVVYFDILYGVNNINDNYKLYKIFFRDVDIAPVSYTHLTLPTKRIV